MNAITKDIDILDQHFSKDANQGQTLASWCRIREKIPTEILSKLVSSCYFGPYLTNRIHSACQKLNLKTLDDIYKTPPRKLLQAPYLGIKCVTTLSEYFKTHNIQWQLEPCKKTKPTEHYKCNACGNATCQSHPREAWGGPPTRCLFDESFPSNWRLIRD